LTGQSVDDAGLRTFVHEEDIHDLIARVINRVELARGELAGLILLADCGELIR